MKQFVFRNTTVEAFFSETDTEFSGYGDITVPDTVYESYCWFYLLPVKYAQQSIEIEIASYYDKLLLLRGSLAAGSVLQVFTLENFHIPVFENANRGLHQAIAAFNENLYELARTNPMVKVIDIADFSKRYASSQLINWKYYFISHMLLNPMLAEAFQEWYKSQLQQIALYRKKCIVLDLDNTLWGGVLGEEGIEGIKIGGEYPGNAFLLFQQALLELAHCGVILCVCSKNNESDVLEVWDKHSSVLIKKDHLATYRINWLNKADNIRAMAEELNIGLDSILFIDDNPTERELVRQLLPMVETPDFPAQPYDLPAFFERLVATWFRIYSLTEEDKQKTEQYRQNAQRTHFQSKFGDMNEYIKSLAIRLKVHQPDAITLPRAAQMTQKTNQFNLTTRRYRDAEIKAFMDAGHWVYLLSVADRFGDNGITGMIIICHTPQGARIDTFLLSCRILGKGIENAFLNTVLAELQHQGITRVMASYCPSKKNGQVQNFYDRAGFARLNHDPEHGTDYELYLQPDLVTITDLYTVEVA